MRAAIAALFLAACATPAAVSHLDHVTGAVHWFDGCVEDGFALAKSTHKPIFLYWGAVWCPPCNQVKSVVFSSPMVGELMKSVIPIYLDGDTERAQVWADKLHVSGYPTLLLLDSAGTELMRISDAVEVAEFVNTFRSAIASGQGQASAVERAKAGKGTHEDWIVLAHSVDAPYLDLFRLVPEQEVALRAAIAARVLETSAEQKDVRVRELAHELIESIFFFDEAVFAARATIVSSSKEVIEWLYPDETDPKRKTLAEKWVKAADWIGGSDGISAETRLLSNAPAVELWQMIHPNEPLSKEVADRVSSAVKRADAEATDAYSRHAIISDAAELLGLIGDLDAARALLTHEIKITDTPWYYQSSLAHLEMTQKNYAAALDWSAKARESAQGKATRLQWLVSDLLLNADVDDGTRPLRVADLLQRYYDLAFELPDGFVGRNGLRAAKIAKAEVTWKWPEVLAVIDRNRMRCPSGDCVFAFPPR